MFSRLRRTLLLSAALLILVLGVANAARPTAARQATLADPAGTTPAAPAVTAPPTQPPAGTLTPTATQPPAGAATATATSTSTPAASPTCPVPVTRRILIVHADNSYPPAPLRSQLLALPGVSGVDLFDAQFGTPALSQLQQYDTVVVFSNYYFANPVALGDALAQYVNGGGVIVAFNYVWMNYLHTIQGQWQAGGYGPFNTNAAGLVTAGSLGTYTPGHPLLQGVATLNSTNRTTVTLAPGATQVAAWNDNVPLLAYKGRVVGVSAYVGAYGNGGGWSGDFARIIFNAATWLGRGTCATPGPTATPMPVLIGHVTWQGRPAQPNENNRLPVTLRLQMAGNITAYNQITADASGFFTVPVQMLPSGTYTWWVKGRNWLATSGTVSLTGASVTRAEMGLQPAGDVNQDNLVDIADFTRLRAAFGTVCYTTGYDVFADFTSDCVIDIADFTMLRGNFGQAGPPQP